MLVTLSGVFFLLMLVSWTAGEEGDLLWAVYKKSHSKSYASADRERAARAAWEHNTRRVRAHNRKGLSFRLAENHLSDLTSRQYLRRVVRLLQEGLEPEGPLLAPEGGEGGEELPEEVDWSPLVPAGGANQGGCGACYAFSLTRALQVREGGPALSAQQLVDCSGRWGNYGCHGGSLKAAARYLQERGAMSARDYPYEGRQARCRWEPRRVVANLSGWAPLPRGDERALQRAAARGPVPVSLSAAPPTFQLYRAGVYDDSACRGEHLNHAMLLVGYSREHWLLLNWWGRGWGEGGYMKLRRGRNLCGVANAALSLDMD